LQKISAKNLQRQYLSSVLLPYLSRPSSCRFSIYGNSGSGKSYLADKILQQYNGLKILIDPDPTKNRGTKITSLETLLRQADNTKNTLVINDLQLFVRCCRMLWHNWTKPCLIMIDEADIIFPNKNPQPELLSLLRRGRRRGMSVGIISQYPTQIHTTARNLINIQICGTFTGRAGRRWSLETFNVDPIEIQPHNFIIRNTYHSQGSYILDF